MLAGASGDAIMASGKVLRLVAFGDSITDYRQETRVYSVQIEERLNHSGACAQVFNAGVPGNNTDQAMARFSRDVLEFHPHLVSMMFGTNDAAIDVWADQTEPRVPVDVYVRNLAAMIGALRERGTQVVLLTPPPMVMTEKLRELYGKPPYTEHGFNFMIDRYIERLGRLAAECGAGLVDVNRAFCDAAGGDEAKLLALLPDGMHAGQTGHDLIAETLFGYLAEHHDLAALADRSPVAIGRLDPERVGHGNGQVELTFDSPQPFDRCQVRFKPHVCGGETRRFGAWRDVTTSIREDRTSVRLSCPGSSGHYRIQLRTLDASGITAIGQIDWVPFENAPSSR